MVANLVSKRDPKIARNSRTSWENWDFPSSKLQISSHKIQFSSTAFRFPRNPRKTSSTAFRFLQRLSAFFNGFPLSSTAFQFSLTAVHFPRNPGKSIYGGRYTKDHLSELRISAKIAIFRDKNNRQQEYERSLIRASYFPLRAS
jgi:hypothetical protein